MSYSSNLKLSFYDKIISSKIELENRIAEAAEPLALVPPALGALLGADSRDPGLEAAIRGLGFAGLLLVEDGLPGYRSELERLGRAGALEDGPLLVTACPPVSAVLASRPGLASQAALAVEPPAERILAEARRLRPRATVFFLSPCSRRAESLAEAIDWAVPLRLLFPEPFALKGPEPRAEGCAASPPARRDCVSGLEAIAAFLEDLDEGKGRGSRGVVELLACSGGCSAGDWAPKGPVR